MKKRALAVLLALVLALALVGCGGSGAGGKDAAEKTVEDSADPAEDADDEDDEGWVDADDDEGWVDADEEDVEGQADAADEDADVEAGAEVDVAEESLPYNELVPVMNEQEFAAAENGSPVTVDTYVQAKHAYHEEESTTCLYTQNEEGAYFVVDLPITQYDYNRLEEGQQIRVSGIKSEASGAVQITEATCQIGDGSYIAEAMDVTDLLGTEELQQYQNRKVVFRDMVSVDIEDVGGDLIRFLYNSEGTGDTGDDLYFCMEKDGQAYTFMVEADLCGPDTELYQMIENFEIDEEAILDLEGYLCWNDGPLPHITSMIPVEE